ncbi:hypothetical protein AWB81_06125 [Caballeronia arationis]|nr:hypothetical protein AWB81_06125 [Caballeronia arationis]
MFARFMPKIPSAPIAIRSALRNAMASARRPFIVENILILQIGTAYCTTAAAMRVCCVDRTDAGQLYLRLHEGYL